MLTILITSTLDQTSDLMMSYFKSDVIRVDLDKMHQCKASCRNDKWHFNGIDVTLSSISAIYWRKPSIPISGADRNADEQLQNFEYRQRLYLLRSLSRSALRNNIWHLVDPLNEYHVPKPFQLQIAKSYFNVPDWGVFTGGIEPVIEPVVSKALSPDPVQDDRHLVTTRLDDLTKLHPDYTWFLQSEVDAIHDCTVIYCCGRLWGFSLNRPLNQEWVDWRLINENHQPGQWTLFEIPSEISDKIKGFMKETQLNYARLDFLIGKDNQWWFLEANPNGQFAWLDGDNKYGVLEHIARCAESSISYE